MFSYFYDSIRKCLFPFHRKIERAIETIDESRAIISTIRFTEKATANEKQF